MDAYRIAYYIFSLAIAGLATYGLGHHVADLVEPADLSRMTYMLVFGFSFVVVRIGLPFFAMVAVAIYSKCRA